MKSKTKIQAKKSGKATKVLRDVATAQESLRPPTKVGRENPPPPKLAELIKLANQVPDGLPSLQDLREDARERTRAEFPGSPVVREAYSEQCLDNLIFRESQKLPVDLRESLGKLPDPSDAQACLFWRISRQQEKLHRNYDYLTQARIAIVVMADGKTEWIGPFHFETWLRKDEKGKLKLEPHPILDALKDIDARRVRRCPICENFFWAGHGNKKWCSPRCSNVFWVRSYREQYTEKYKLQRIDKAEQADNKHSLKGK